MFQSSPSGESSSQRPTKNRPGAGSEPNAGAPAACTAGTNAADAASAAPVATARVTDAVGTQQIEVRKDKDKNYYAKSSAVEGVYKVGNELGEGLDANGIALL